MQLRWQIRRGAHFQRILILATARTLSLRRLRDSARGLSKEYPGRLRSYTLARRPARSRARAGGAGAAQFNSIRRAREQYSGFPRRYTVTRYRIRGADRQSDVYTYVYTHAYIGHGDHDYVGLAQARPNYHYYLRSIMRVRAPSRPHPPPRRNRWIGYFTTPIGYPQVRLTPSLLFR